MGLSPVSFAVVVYFIIRSMLDFRLAVRAAGVMSIGPVSFAASLGSPSSSKLLWSDSSCGISCGMRFLLLRLLTVSPFGQNHHLGSGFLRLHSWLTSQLVTPTELRRRCSPSS